MTLLAQDLFPGFDVPILDAIRSNIFTVGDLTELVALVPPADRSAVYVEDEQSWYFYDAQSTAAVSSPNVLVPDTITPPVPGRWLLSSAGPPPPHNHVASDTTDFDTEVANNAAVTTNTSKVSADGSVETHSDVTAAGSGIIISAVERTKLDGIATAATADAKATQSETDAGTNDVLFITPKTLNDRRVIEGFFLDPKGLIGSGVGWADEGIIGEVPVLLFSQTVSEDALFMFFALPRGRFDVTDPIVRMTVYSTGAPTAGTDDEVNWQLEVRYIALGESTEKAADQTLTPDGGATQVLPTIAANAFQGLVSFTLDRALITTGDVIALKLSRLADATNKYGDDVGIGQTGILVETVI